MILERLQLDEKAGSYVVDELPARELSFCFDEGAIVPPYHIAKPLSGRRLRHRRWPVQPLASSIEV